MPDITTAVDLVDHLTGMADSLDEHVEQEQVHEQLLVARTMAVELTGELAAARRDRQLTAEENRDLLAEALGIDGGHPVLAVLSAVLEERARQDAKWGQQNHPDGTGPRTTPLFSPVEFLDDHLTADIVARKLRDRCERRFAIDPRHREEPAGTWRDIFLEEGFEALAEDDPMKLRGELVQSAAVLVAWIEAIDRRTEADRG